MNLRNRIMLLVALGLLVATAPLAVMGLGMVRAATDRVLEERLATTRATSEHLGKRLAEGWSQLHQLSARLSADLDHGPAAQQRDLAALSPQMSLFSGGIFFVDRQGRIVAQEPQGKRLSALAGEATLRRVMATGVPAASPILRLGSRDAVVFFAVPVYRSAQQIAGAAGGVIDLNTPTLLTFLEGLATGPTGHAAIVGADGLVVASTDSVELFSRNEHPEFFARFIAEGRPLVGTTVEDHGPQVAGESHVMAFAPIPTVPWGLGIGQSEEETFGPLRRLRDRILVFELVVLTAALAFAWIDTGAVAAPLRLLREATERIAGGDLNRQIAVHRGDEIGALARSFEEMRLQLAHSLEENARLQDRLQSLAMVEERERIAREMHDSVGQVLGYVNTKAQAVQALLAAGRAAEAQVQLRQLEDAARDVYADLREAILSLRTPGSPPGPLLPVLGDYVRRFTELSGIETTLTCTVPPAHCVLTPTTELHLLRIVQEALTNVRKHALARRAWVRIGERGGMLTVTVTDDGVGFTEGGPPAARGTGFGLLMMRERAEAIGATLSVGLAEGAGTAVEVALPMAGEG